MKKINTAISTNCKLVVSPIEQIKPDDNKVCVEYLSSELDIDVLSTVSVHKIFPISYEYKLLNDGLYIYTRFTIYTKKYLDTEQITDLENTIFYDESKSNLNSGLRKYIKDPKTKQVIAVEVTNNDLLEVTNDINNNFYSKYRISNALTSPIYSICKLEKCLENKQRKFIFNTTFDNRIDYCEESKKEKFNRDFLFSTVFVMKLLINQQRFEEANRILNSVTSCNELCTDININNNCGCN